MKQIDFYRNIAKDVILSGPAIIKGQHYKCVVFQSLDNLTTGVITATAKATQGVGCPCATAVFKFSSTQTKTLILGDNNLCVYDVAIEESESESDSESYVDTERTIYKVYEAKVYAAESYPNKVSE